MHLINFNNYIILHQLIYNNSIQLRKIYFKKFSQFEMSHGRSISSSSPPANHQPASKSIFRCKAFQFRLHPPQTGPTISIVEKITRAQPPPNSKSSVQCIPRQLRFLPTEWDNIVARSIVERRTGLSQLLTFWHVLPTRRYKTFNSLNFWKETNLKKYPKCLPIPSWILCWWGGRRSTRLWTMGIVSK